MFGPFVHDIDAVYKLIIYIAIGVIVGGRAIEVVFFREYRSSLYGLPPETGVL